MKPTVRPDDGFEYYSYILFYVDDCLAINHDAEQCLQEIDKFFPMKQGSIGDPDIYLGAKLRQVKLNNGVNAWSFSPTKYVQEAVGNVEKFIDKNMGGIKLTNRVSGPWPTDYQPELDETEILNDEMTNYYQSLIGSLHWMLEPDRVDIITKISLLAGKWQCLEKGICWRRFTCSPTSRRNKTPGWCLTQPIRRLTKACLNITTGNDAMAT
jgi:hypothetical protein